MSEGDPYVAWLLAFDCRMESLRPLSRVPKGEPTAFAGAGRAVEFSRATDVALIRNHIGREPGG